MRFLRDLAFQLIKYLTCKHISSLLKLFNIHTSHLDTLQTAKRVKEKHYMYSCFIYHKNFIFRFSHFESHPKTVNIQGYSELQEPIRTYENCYPLFWWILILVKFMSRDLWRVYTFWWCSSFRQLYPGTNVPGPSMEPDSHCFLTLITKHQSHLALSGPSAFSKIPLWSIYVH